MTIFTNNDVFVSSLSRRVVIATDTSYVGQVISTFSKVERIMSDVWDDVFYAVVAEVGQLGYVFKTIRLGCSEFGYSYAVVDAPEHAKAAYAAYLVKCEQDRQAAESARLREQNARIEAARRVELARAAALPKHGDLVVVSVDRRCRNPQVQAANGCIGKVFWVRDGRFGVTLSDERDARGNFTKVVWCNEKQIRKTA